MIAEFLLVKYEGQYEAALYVNGKHVNGPLLLSLLNPPKEDLTHWMGNRPTVGLTASEAGKSNCRVRDEKSVTEPQ